MSPYFVQLALASLGLAVACLAAWPWLRASHPRPGQSYRLGLVVAGAALALPALQALVPLPTRPLPLHEWIATSESTPRSAGAGDAGSSVEGNATRETSAHALSTRPRDGVRPNREQAAPPHPRVAPVERTRPSLARSELARSRRAASTLAPAMPGLSTDTLSTVEQSWPARTDRARSEGARSETETPDPTRPVTAEPEHSPTALALPARARTSLASDEPTCDERHSRALAASSPRAPNPGGWLPSWNRATHLLALVHGLGLAVGAWRLARRLSRARALLARSHAARHPELLELWREVRTAMPSNARLRTTADLDAPACVGLVRPTILMPSRQPGGDALGDARERTRYALTHEAVHARRADGLALFAQEVFRLLYWFHPSAHWLCRRLDLARELSCDAAVVNTTGERRGYASALLEYAERMKGPIERRLPSPSPALLSWAGSSSSLHRRIQMLVRPDRSAPKGRGLAPLVLGCFLPIWGGQWFAASGLRPPATEPSVATVPVQFEGQGAALVATLPQRADEASRASRTKVEQRVEEARAALAPFRQADPRTGVERRRAQAPERRADRESERPEARFQFDHDAARRFARSLKQYAKNVDPERQVRDLEWATERVRGAAPRLEPLLGRFGLEREDGVRALAQRARFGLNALDEDAIARLLVQVGERVDPEVARRLVDRVQSSLRGEDAGRGARDSRARVRITRRPESDGAGRELRIDEAIARLHDLAAHADPDQLAGHLSYALSLTRGLELDRVLGVSRDDLERAQRWLERGDEGRIRMLVRSALSRLDDPETRARIAERLGELDPSRLERLAAGWAGRTGTSLFSFERSERTRREAPPRGAARSTPERGHGSECAEAGPSDECDVESGAPRRGDRETEAARELELLQQRIAELEASIADRERELTKLRAKLGDGRRPQ